MLGKNALAYLAFVSVTRGKKILTPTKIFHLFKTRNFVVVMWCCCGHFKPKEEEENIFVEIWT